MSNIEIGTKVKITGATCHNIKDGSIATIVYDKDLSELALKMSAVVVRGEINDEVLLEAGREIGESDEQVIPLRYVEIV